MGVYNQLSLSNAPVLIMFVHVHMNVNKLFSPSGDSAAGEVVGLVQGGEGGREGLGVGRGGGKGGVGGREGRRLGGGG